MEDEGKESVDGRKPSFDNAADRHASIERNPEKSADKVAPDAAGDTHNKHEKGDPFGDESDAAVRYRTLTWWQAGVIMVAETVSIGILSLPSVLASVGMVAGVILLIGLGLIATYTGYVMGQFKKAYPHVHNMADVGEILLGPVGRELFGAAQTIFLVFVMGSHILTFTIAFNTITDQATCTIVWGAVGTVIFIILSLPRTLRSVSYLAIASFISILSAVLITMIGIGIERPDAHIQASTTIGFASAFQSVSNIIFAYGGHVAFFSFISELKDPNDFPKALYFLQFWDMTLYLIVGIVVYYYGGPNVSSPALSSTSPVVAKVAYGIALPTILIAGVVYNNVAVKYVYVRLFRGTKHMSQRTWKSVGTWIGLVAIFWIIAWIIAESIPVFNDLLSLISALFVSWFTYGLSGFFWLFLNYGQWFVSSKKASLAILNMVIFCLGGAICGIGLYASGKAIHDDSGSGQSWSCSRS